MSVLFNRHWKVEAYREARLRALKKDERFFAAMTRFGRSNLPTNHVLSLGGFAVMKYGNRGQAIILSPEKPQKNKKKNKKK